MTDTETKALKLLNDCGGDVLVVVRNGNAWVEALCRAIEQRDAIQKEHDDYKQKVSDAAEEATDIIDHWSGDRAGAKCLQDFIIPKPKPDPLLAALLELELSSDLQEGQHDAKWIRNKLDELGFEIREKNDG